MRVTHSGLSKSKPRQQRAQTKTKYKSSKYSRWQKSKNKTEAAGKLLFLAN